MPGTFSISPHRWGWANSVLLILLLIGGGQAHSGERRLIGPECAHDLSRVRSQFPDMEPSKFYLIVRHHGDPGSAEWLGQIANPVSWPVSTYTGFSPPAPLTRWQRGYYDHGPPIGSSAVQWHCDNVGFLLNTYQFTHTKDVVGGGPNIVYEQIQPRPQPQPWTRPGSGLVIEFDLQLPWVYAVQLDPATGRGTGQVSLFYYAESAESGRIFAHVINLFDSRPYGMGNGGEFLGHDTFYDFASSPLDSVTAGGGTPRYLRLGAGSARFQAQSGWTQRRHFRAEIGWEHLQRVLDDLRARGNSETNPANFRLRSVGVLIEAFPGNNNDHNVSFAGSFAGFKVSSIDPLLVFQDGLER